MILYVEVTKNHYFFSFHAPIFHTKIDERSGTFFERGQLTTTNVRWGAGRRGGACKTKSGWSKIVCFELLYFLNDSFSKNNFKFNQQKYYFLYFHEVIIKCYPNFVTCLYSPLALIRWTSSHCHLMELFIRKQSFEEKVNSNNNLKTAWPRMILECHLFLRLWFGFVRKMLSFMGKHLSFYPKDVSSFSAFFYLNDFLMKSTSHKNKGRSKNIFQLQKHHL